MTSRRLVSIAAPGIVALWVGESSAQAPSQRVRYVPDVVGQFNALTERPDAMGFEIGHGPDPSACRHMQAIVRTEASDGTPYFIVSRSGTDVSANPFHDGDSCVYDIEPWVGNPIGNLYIVRMGSRDKNGERLRSNRLRRDLRTTLTPPDPADGVVRSILFDGTGEWPNYSHPAGMQQVGSIVGLALSHPEQDDLPPVTILFLDVSDPENPQIRSRWVPPDPDVKAGDLALIPCGADRVDMPCAAGHYLMLLTGDDNSTLWFYESNSTPKDDVPPWDQDRDGSTDLASPDLSWDLLDTWTVSEDEQHLGANWHDDHQTLQFLREGGPSGALYLAGARGHLLGDDYIDLYRVELDGSAVRMTLVSTHHKISHPAGEGEAAGARNANFGAATGFHVTPTGELILYATEHDNDGPEGTNGRASVKMGEWRHIDVVRPGSPTLSPTVEATAPFVVDEGASTLLQAVGRPPITKAWIELFSDTSYKGRYLVVDYDDRNKENLDDFKRLDPGFYTDANGFSDEASSWRWFAPLGCTLRVNDDDFGDSSFPGDHTRTLPGRGQRMRDPNLGNVLNDALTDDVDDESTSVQFFSNCDTYYNATPNLSWDLDADGTFETTGNTVPFGAGNRDGPTEVRIRVQIGSPRTAGPQGRAVVTVTVNNVAPIVDSWRAFDAGGRVVGVGVPFVLQGRPVVVRGQFTDPGRRDRQSASVDWGGGEADDSFRVFRDAFGGRVGRLRERRTFTVTGAYEVALDVTDDDGGTTRSTVGVTVFSPIAAVTRIVAHLDARIASAGPTRTRKLLIQARRTLAGDANGGGDGGALRKLVEHQTAAALARLHQALTDLQRVSASGADVSVQIALVKEVIESVSLGF